MRSAYSVNDTDMERRNAKTQRSKNVGNGNERGKEGTDTERHNTEARRNEALKIEVRGRENDIEQLQHDRGHQLCRYRIRNKPFP